MGCGRAEQELGASADGRGGIISPLCSFAQHTHDGWMPRGRFRAFAPALWSDSERDIKKLSIAAVSVLSVCGAMWVY